MKIQGKNYQFVCLQTVVNPKTGGRGEAFIATDPWAEAMTSALVTYLRGLA
jgi:hypothetical protein